jgi:hypothetical protein
MRERAPDRDQDPSRPAAVAGARGSLAESDRGARPAYYALRPGGWRDYWTLLHPPYTAWHLSYVAIGAAVAPNVSAARLAASVVAFFLGVGVCAHALDELNGRPLHTRIPRRILVALAGASLVGAVSLGFLGAAELTWWLLAFVAFGSFIVLAYNLELFGRRFHSDLWFAVAWGAFPAVTGYFAQSGSLRWPVVPVAGACLFVSLAQRHLSTPARQLRRRVASVDGTIVLRDGREVPVDAALLRAAPEAALRALAVAMALLAAGLVAARLG